MKNILTSLFVMAMLLFSCGGGADNATAKAEEEKLKQEIITADSTAAALETLKEEIEESSEKLDELLNDI